MDASAWRAVDQMLGVAELVLVPASVIYLFVALTRLGRARTLRALAIVGVTALVVAQPFGVKGIPISPEEFSADNPRQMDSEAIHSVRVLGTPVFGFRPYTTEIFRFNGDGGNPTHWLKVRSWLWPGAFTNGERLDAMCGLTDSPCWEPEGAGQTGKASPSNLELVKAGNEWRYRILTADGRPPSPDDVDDYHGYYRLTIGLVSEAGLVYWLLVATLGVGLLARWQSARSQTNTAGRSAVAGPNP